jgi:energy-coupling factor transporter ATP-binding protein EcfA2
LQRSIAALFSSQTLLFVGMSLKGINEFLSSLPAEVEGGSHTHYALVPMDANAELWQAGLGRKYGIEIIEFLPSEDFREVPDAIAALNASVRTGTPEQIKELSQASAKLSYVQLKSIGIFKELSVDLAPGWTLLLGNNGGGKSTILRAIALALSGSDPRLPALSGRLLRSGESLGVIEIGVGTGHIVTHLVRDDKLVKVSSPQTTLLQSGQMLVLAFPALRGVVTTQSHGPTNEAASNPSVDDVLPLLQGMVDSRLNNLQQWLVNAVLRAETNPGGRDSQLLATFNSLIAEMVPGGRIKFSQLDRTTWTVYFSIDEVNVPFDGISQGMSSILNWVGVLLQRLYDVYPNSQVPENEAALVLIDEIDAHLHPIWQRQLVTLTRKKFPNVQVVASSHSPFLAGAVSREELRIVERDATTDQIRATMPAEDLSGQKVEDILTSSLFSLTTTRSPDAEQEIKRYFELFEKPSGSLKREEEVELKELRERLEGLNYGPTLKQRKVNEQIKADIDAQLKTLSPEAIATMQVMLRSGSKEASVAESDTSAPL